jgi:alkylhydroperoxidase family enzyme
LGDCALPGTVAVASGKEGFRRLILAVWTSGTVDPQLKPMVALMTSHGTSCRYCQAHEIARSERAGVRWARLSSCQRESRS